MHNFVDTQINVFNYILFPKSPNCFDDKAILALLFFYKEIETLCRVN